MEATTKPATPDTDAAYALRDEWDAEPPISSLDDDYGWDEADYGYEDYDPNPYDGTYSEC